MFLQELYFNVSAYTAANDVSCDGSESIPVSRLHFRFGPLKSARISVSFLPIVFGTVEINNLRLAIYTVLMENMTSD